jgi:undecaprenyl-diphosphatase
MVRQKIRRQLKHQKTILFVSLLALGGFLFVALFRSNFIGVDSTLNVWAASIQTSGFTIVALMLSNIFDTNIVITISVIVAVGLIVKNHKRYSLLLFCAVVGDVLIVEAIKMLIAAPRPLKGMIVQTGYSFPSGHVVGTVVFFGFLTYFAWQIWRSSIAKATIGSLYVAVTFLVGFDRIYLNVHWLSDVLGAYLLGVFWLTFVLIIFRFFETTTFFKAYGCKLRGSKKQINSNLS